MRSKKQLAFCALHTSAIGALIMLVSLCEARAQVMVSNGWFRALPPAVPSGGYFDLHNSGSKTVVLTELTSPACGMLMMHKSENGGMEHLMSLDVTAGQTVHFAPGGYHLMCMDAKFQPGTKVPVTLEFKDGSHVVAQFQVRSATGK